ncbi:MAG TPA: hypothetical protein VNO14_19160, partial [Blastocatellia bacterium]|nr:hypothetical protein [Blastocatellia bacterium]
MRLLAHELMHTIQQRSTPAPIIQRQPAQPGASITAQDLFPFPKGSRILLGNALPELISRILSIAQPATVAALNAINNQVATVLTSTPDLFEARVAGPITIPAVAGQDARTIRDIILSLRRTNNTFEFSLTGIEDKQTVRSSLIPPEAFGQMRGLTASREGGGIVLSRPADTGTEPLLDVTRGESGEIILRAFTEALTGQKISPERVEVISLTSLPDAQTKAEADRAVSKIIERQEKRRQTPRQELSFGLGGQFADRNAFLLTTSWQIRFPSTRLLGPLGLKPLTREIVGQLLQFPLELQIQYAPGASVLGSVSTGPALRIPKSVPINLRLVAGVAGGRAAEGGGNATVFGPTVGAAAGFELGRWRVNVRFERLL